MTLLLGYSYAHDNSAGLEFAGLLARSSGQELLAVVVTPAPWPTPAAAKTDREFAAWSSDLGAKAVAEAEQQLAELCPKVTTRAIHVPGRSVPAALQEAADTHDAAMIIVGSGRNGAYGHVHLSSTADRLLHSSQVPVAIATRGFHSARDSRVRRATCAFRGDADSRSALAVTARLCTEHDAALRVATFAVRGRTMYPPEVGLNAEDLVLQQWIKQAGDWQVDALMEVAKSGTLPRDTTRVVASGRHWGAALDELPWERDEVLVVGSSPAGLMERIFLGSSGSKLVRHSPVPVIVVR